MTPTSTREKRKIWLINNALFQDLIKTNLHKIRNPVSKQAYIPIWLTNLYDFFQTDKKLLCCFISRQGNKSKNNLISIKRISTGSYLFLTRLNRIKTIKSQYNHLLSIRIMNVQFSLLTTRQRPISHNKPRRTWTR